MSPNLENEQVDGRQEKERATFIGNMAVNGIVNSTQKDISPNLINELKCSNGKSNGYKNNLKNGHIKVCRFLSYRPISKGGVI